MRVPYVAVMALNRHNIVCKLGCGPWEQLLLVGHALADHADDMDIIPLDLPLRYTDGDISYVATLGYNCRFSERLNIFKLS